MRSCLSILLAAGEGVRMKSSLPKVLHKIAGLSLIGHVINTLKQVAVDHVAVVVGHGADAVKAEVAQQAPSVQFFHQNERLGTAHAVLAARKALEQNYDDVVIVFGDTPLIEPDSLNRARAQLALGADVVVLGFHTDHPEGYGRLIEKSGRLTAIIEEKDANEQQKTIPFCNGGVMAVAGKHLLALLEGVDNHNASQEFYLTDIVALAYSANLDVRALRVAEDNFVGINSRVDLAQAEKIWQERKRNQFMTAGVTMMSPESVYFSYDTVIGQDVVIEPNVYFGPNVRVESGAMVKAFSYIEGAFVGCDAQIGPFARLRAGSNLGPKVKVGNFCEVKNAKIDHDAKVNHLSYIGDATIGSRTNVGAGTITCNYDGFKKWHTEIGRDAFIGSNTSLVAPINIGEAAYIGSGSVITEDVPANALALGRARQVNKLDYGQHIRDRKSGIVKVKK